MTFYTWLIEKHLGKDSRTGDLAMDIASDKNFPRFGTLDKIMLHLYSQGACDAAIETFKGAWRAYERYEKAEQIKRKELITKLFDMAINFVESNRDDMAWSIAIDTAEKVGTEYSDSRRDVIAVLEELERRYA